jgi:hypothetical protein
MRALVVLAMNVHVGPYPNVGCSNRHARNMPIALQAASANELTWEDVCWVLREVASGDLHVASRRILACNVRQPFFLVKFSWQDVA